MSATKTLIGLELVFLTLFAVHGNKIIKAEESGQDAEYKSWKVNITDELLSISKSYCSLLLKEEEWQVTASIISNHLVVQAPVDAFRSDHVTKLQLCASWRRGVGTAPLPEEEPEPDVPDHSLYSILTTPFSYAFSFGQWVTSFPEYFGEKFVEYIDWELSDNHKLTNEEVWHIYLYLSYVVGLACDNKTFLLNNKQVKANMKTVEVRRLEVKDDGFLEQMTHVREMLEKCTAGDGYQFWETEQTRRERLAVDEFYNSQVLVPYD
ncbi:unnamed protein product [Orchesella dallaii]|uniref:Uncharacterized protein n=1 Tax=Orchesella dallaii TaxID=48710 RepID=A0ABP1Q112_9HEXA